MVRVMICVCGKNLRDGEDVKFHLTEHPTHIIDVQQWEFVQLPSYSGWSGPQQWLKIAEWTVKRNVKKT